MSNFESLLQWARGNGVVIRGIQPADIPGHGTGIIATRALKAGEVLLEAPPRVVRCLNTVPPAIRKRLPLDMPIHGLLAASLVLDPGLPSAWKAILPAPADLEAGMPCLWPRQLQALLPRDAQSALNTQKANLQRQWTTFSRAFPDVPEKEFRHAWLLVNSRSFLDGTPETQTYPWEDRLALIPVADLFNHGEVGARVNVLPEGGYIVTADRAYGKGEEILIVYGNHPNDFMLVEYGFILDRNRSDDVLLDDWIVPGLSEEHKAELERRGCLGTYPLRSDAEDAHRTQAALHLLCCSPYQCTHFTASRDCQGRVKVNTYLIDLLELFLADIRAKLGRLEGLEVGSDVQRALLQKRWRQILAAVESRIEELRQETKERGANGSLGPGCVMPLRGQRRERQILT